MALLNCWNMNSKSIIRAAPLAGCLLICGVLLPSVLRATVAGMPAPLPGPNLPGTIKGSLETYCPNALRAE